MKYIKSNIFIIDKKLKIYLFLNWKYKLWQFENKELEKKLIRPKSKSIHDYARIQGKIIIYHGMKKNCYKIAYTIRI